MSIIDTMSPSPPTALPSIKGAARTTEFVAVPRFAPAPRIVRDKARLGVNAASIQDAPAHTQTPRNTGAQQAENFEQATPLPANDPFSQIPARPFAERPVSRQSGLRLLPAEGFLWGKPGPVPTPRTRGDHTLIWVQEGALRLGFPRGDRVHGAGSLHFIPAGTAFSALPLKELRGHVALISPDIAEAAAAELPNRVTQGRLAQGDADILEMGLHGLANEARGQDAASRAAAACHLGLIAVRLHRIASESLPTPSANPDPARPLVDRFAELAGREYGRGRTIADLAEALGSDVASLDRACQEARGQSALELIYALRHDRAAELLRDPSRPIGGIAQQLGYASLAHFNRAFQQATGRLPETFRDETLARINRFDA